MIVFKIMQFTASVKYWILEEKKNTFTKHREETRMLDETKAKKNYSFSLLW